MFTLAKHLFNLIYKNIRIKVRLWMNKKEGVVKTDLDVRSNSSFSKSLMNENELKSRRTAVENLSSAIRIMERPYNSMQR